LLRKANATKECGNDVRELRCCGEFGKLCGGYLWKNAGYTPAYIYDDCIFSWLSTMY